MKIAVAVENNQVCGHFGHSPSFSFYEIEDGKIVSVTNIQSPGKGHGILPEFIAENGATAVLVGGMGAGAVSGCQSKGIEVVMGVTGNPDDAASLYAKGELKSTGIVIVNMNTAMEKTEVVLIMVTVNVVINLTLYI